MRRKLKGISGGTELYFLPQGYGGASRCRKKEKGGNRRRKFPQVGRDTFTFSTGIVFASSRTFIHPREYANPITSPSPLLCHEIDDRLCSNLAALWKYPSTVESSGRIDDIGWCRSCNRGKGGRCLSTWLRRRKTGLTKRCDYEFEKAGKNKVANIPDICQSWGTKKVHKFVTK